MTALAKACRNLELYQAFGTNSVVAIFIPVLLIGELESERSIELVSGGARREPIRSFIHSFSVFLLSA